ncbi:MAG: hypothetical protein E5W81_01060 [Mesorhizobium sp.]|nr:MAG: hypothetical protein E5V36_01980 [Mesorhizobium sp.]TKC01647.1 MAG: hypothetical protein E5W81_01060 [Mesorhizobium sp.]
MPRAPKSQFLRPKDRAICQRVVDQIAADAKSYSTSVDSQILASTTLSLFQSGVVNEVNLLAHVRARRHDFTKQAGTASQLAS